MVQRNKVLDIDGPTPKFLYAMLKQLDLKIVSTVPIDNMLSLVDWNHVASEIGISNGHAARMRFSRFRNQMEGTTGAQRRKRNPKKGEDGGKGEKGDPKPLMPPTQQSNPVHGPAMETANSSAYTNPVKREHGDHVVLGSQQFPDMGEVYPWSQVIPTSEGSYTPQMHPFMQQEMSHGIPHGTPYHMASGMASGFPMVSQNPSSFYSPFSMPQDFVMQDMASNMSSFNPNGVPVWESFTPPMAESEIAPVKIEENCKSIEVKLEQGMELKTHQSAFDQSPAATWRSSTPPTLPKVTPVKIEDDHEPVEIKTEPRIPIRIKTEAY
ncbi:hypothetical protein N7520_008192 [Penicillium odoratum]|uniref:uncharacterized protein n=1 Tax=Penicillium odoratum TaxID=1167516 RepID=UPI00254850D9|nr:uncharacterized protein N7520_008192 [Penicillium odoratum]KAJ5761036.1 hypothetical protein N7520_008192 [Penicillium odoratum]